MKVSTILLGVVGILLTTPNTTGCGHYSHWGPGHHGGERGGVHSHSHSHSVRSSIGVRTTITIKEKNLNLPHLYFCVILTVSWSWSWSWSWSYSRSIWSWFSSFSDRILSTCKIDCCNFKDIFHDFKTFSTGHHGIISVSSGTG